MSDYDDTNRGALFANDKKTQENQPNMRGTLNVAGVEYWVSAWTKTSKSGMRFQSLSVTPKEQQSTPQPAAPQAAPVTFDDDIPF